MAEEIGRVCDGEPIAVENWMAVVGLSLAHWYLNVVLYYESSN